MSSPKTLDEKSNRRRSRRQQAEEPVENLEVQDDLEDGDEESELSARGITERKGRPTPSRRSLEVEESHEGGNIVTRFVRGTREYFEGVRSELGKVAWPTREEVIRLTWIVLGATIAASIALGVIAFIFTELFVAGLNTPAIFVALTVVVVVILAVYLRRSNRSVSGY